MRLAIALQTVTGDLGRPGGSSGGQTWGGLPSRASAASRCRRDARRPAASPPTTGRTPCCAGAPAATRPTSRPSYDTGGNYVVQGADVALNIRAMESLEFSVCHDLFLTTTARYCDVVLPATHWLERSDIVFTSANYLLYSHRVAAPPGQARDDYDIFADLAERDGLRRRVHGGQGRGGVAERTSSRTPRSPTPRSSGAPASTGAPIRSASALAAFAADPVARAARDAVGQGRAQRRRLRRRRPVGDARRRACSAGRPDAAAAARHPQVALPRPHAARRDPLVPRARRPHPVDPPRGRRRARPGRRRRGRRRQRAGQGALRRAA